MPEHDRPDPGDQPDPGAQPDLIDQPNLNDQPDLNDRANPHDQHGARQGHAGPHHLDRGTTDRVSLGLVRLMKLLQSMKLHAPRLHPAVDATAYPLLFNLLAQPRRVSALADVIHSDVSTVSRQVSTLVGHGLLEKVSDPEDGRAQVVRLTDEGHTLLHAIQQQRTEWFRDLMDDWTPDQVSDFADHLERFGSALETNRESLLRRRAPQPTPAAPTGDTSTSEN
jgi:DNA-binding MarR family transcriptional regulator